MYRLPWVDFHVSFAKNQPLFQQIYEHLRAAILDGRLSPGDRLPSSREFAASLGVSRNTASAAFDHLTGEGYLASRPGVGTFVSSAVARRLVTPPRDRASPLRIVPFWRHDSTNVPDFATVRQAEYDFRVGIPDATGFPYPTWRRLLDEATRPSAGLGGIYSDPAGPLELRQAIAHYLGVARGLQINATDVVVTNGVQQAVNLIAQVLVEPGDVVAVEDPGYPPVRRAFEAARATVVGIPVDEEGLVVDALPDNARIAYVTPAHQFPLGVRMSLPRRSALLEWAHRVNAAVLEDDYDTDFRYAGRPVDPLHALDRAGRVIYVGSFSKTMAPALRLGYAVLPHGLAGPVRRARFIADWHGPLGPQLALARFIDEGRLGAHVRRMRRTYEARRNRIAAVLDAELPGDLVRIPNLAGLHLAAWARDAGHDEVDSWVERAAGRGVAVQALHDFAETPTRPGLLLGFGAIPLDRIEAGLRRLRGTIRSD